MIQKDLQEVKNLIEHRVQILTEKHYIKLIYIFGSYAKGKNDKNSDLDIAILLNKGYNPMEKLDLIGELTDIFKRNDIDLVILNDANEVLKHQIIKYGKIVYMENEDIKVNFEVRVLKEYMDMEPFRRTQMKYIKEWFKSNYGGI